MNHHPQPAARHAQPLVLEKLATIHYDTDDFRENSVRILAAACAKSPACRVLPHDVVGVLRFRDVDALLRDPLTFSSKLNLAALEQGVDPIRALIGDDPPDHTRIRALFAQAFTPARVSSTMEPRVLAIARELVAKVLDAGPEFDLVSDIATVLPVTVISELLGVDATDLPLFKRWSEDITGGILFVAMPEGDEKTERMAQLHRSARELDDYLVRVIAERHYRPGDDLITFMVQASEGGTKLRSSEVLSLAKLLLVAGNDTTTKLIGLMMNQLLSSPPSLASITESPGLIAGAIEETLRLEGPVYSRLRRTTRACSVAGFAVPANALVDVVIGAANLDQRVFPDPTKFDIRRKIMRHFGFGGGIHQCLGAPLARLETRIVFEELVEHMRDISYASPPVRGTVSSFRGFESMPLRYQHREKRVPPSARRATEEVSLARRIAFKSDAELGLDRRAQEIVRVARVRDIAENIKMFRLVHPTGGLLTRFTAGSHIILHMHGESCVYRNVYSLLNCEYGNGFSYIFAAALDPNGRGGSRFLHEKVTVGMELGVSVPANNFPAAAHAAKHLLVAGGIGITPLFALRHELRVRNEPCELHYAFRSAAKAAFVEELDLEGDPRVRLYDNERGQRLDVEALVRSQPERTHVYVCGPEGLMNAVIACALSEGWPEEMVHFERFGATKTKGEKPFVVTCQRSQRTLTVGADETLLEALEREGLAVPFSCRAGSCGSCEIGVLEGEIDHRDSVLSEPEQAAGNKILACVSRGKTRLLLDV